MGQDLVEIEPRELQFTFEVKKQSSCSVHLVNTSNEYVAFKVKTTSPKRYCVRPNTGVILPRSTCDFTVTMQAQRTAPPDMQLKDKFLVQTTVVPYGTADEDIVPAFFSKETGRYIEENKLRVVLVSASQSLAEQPINGASDPEPAVEVPVLKETLNVLKETPNVLNETPTILKESPPLKETPAPVEEAPAALKESPAPLKESPVDFKKSPLLMENPGSLKQFVISSDRELVNVDSHHLSHVTEDVEYLKSKLNNLETKLEDAEKMIIKLREESKTTILERDNLQQEMVFLRRKGTPRNQAGFPLLFVVYMALLGAALGYLVRL